MTGTQARQYGIPLKSLVASVSCSMPHRWQTTRPSSIMAGVASDTSPTMGRSVCEVAGIVSFFLFLCFESWGHANYLHYTAFSGYRKRDFANYCNPAFSAGHSTIYCAAWQHYKQCQHATWCPIVWCMRSLSSIERFCHAGTRPVFACFPDLAACPSFAFFATFRLSALCDKQSMPRFSSPLARQAGTSKGHTRLAIVSIYRYNILPIFDHIFRTFLTLTNETWHDNCTRHFCVSAASQVSQTRVSGVRHLKNGVS